jgi:glyoxylase-like metal-dependent hydrolase (beta-lactamase superfamily II)
VAVVDLGTGGSADAIGSALKAAGSGWNAVRHVILTHQHDDHAGGLAEVAPQVNATIYAGEADVAGITSEKPVRPVKDGDEVFGLRIIGTPGHTAGHVSVFDPSTGVLVAGDALRTTDGLVGSDPQYTADETAAAASVRKLATLDVRTVLPGHGDPLTTDAAGALRKLAASLAAG